ncbi:hypothetical protein DXV75_10190 [Alteromonas aestuariivivens]|uniref:Solute-binding protein family 3/N-terminal domain-containing protein n=1 Tax=Alteromonas aestuariivivens TaxID=1938339 RepID=A0A3D8M7V9_9ALTE|nr:transporter substrate-binding domain-containing protein [Alteromonas aestuariivivens]RDV25644.1 hypothetical protein DXV75_10190 [Alteromonas aestuariivivens]
MQLKVVVFTSWLLATFWSLAGYAAPLRMLVTDMPLFVDPQPNGEVSGYAVEMAAEIAREAGFELQPYPMPLARKLAELNNHPPQTLAIVNRTEDREADYFWITPIVAVPVTLFVRSDSELVNAGSVSIADIKSVSAVRNEYRHRELKARGAKNIMAVKGWEHAVEAVLKGRVESILFSPLGLRLICIKQHLNCSDLQPVLTLQTRYTYLALPRISGNQALAERLTFAASRYKNQRAFEEQARALLSKLMSVGHELELRDGILFEKNYYPDIEERKLWVIADKIPFFVEQDERGRIHGYGASLVTGILAQAGITQQRFLVAPWERIFRESLTKSNVLAFAITRTPQRESLFHWITPLTRARQGVYGLNAVKYASLAQLPPDTRVAVLSGDFRVERARQLGLDPIEYDSLPVAIEAVYGHDAELVFTSSAGLTLACQKLAHKCNGLALAAEDDVSTTYLVLSKQGTTLALVERLKLAAVREKESDTYIQWSREWSDDLNRQGLLQHISEGVVNVWPKGQ